MVTVSNTELFLVSFDSFSPSHHVKWRWGGLSAFAGAGGMGKALRSGPGKVPTQSTCRAPSLENGSGSASAF